MSTSPLAPRTVAFSAAREHLYKVFPNDLNAYNTMFGGTILATIDRLASIVAERHAGKVCVTASVDAVHFMAPARHGDTLVFSAAVNRAWGSSMEIGAKVIAEDFLSNNTDKRHIVSAYLTFVALDENNKPTPIPSLIAESALEQQRYAEADFRRQLRLSHAEQIKQHRSSL